MYATSASRTTWDTDSPRSAASATAGTQTSSGTRTARSGVSPMSVHCGLVRAAVVALHLEQCRFRGLGEFAQVARPSFLMVGAADVALHLEQFRLRGHGYISQVASTSYLKVGVADGDVECYRLGHDLMSPLTGGSLGGQWPRVRVADVAHQLSDVAEAVFGAVVVGNPFTVVAEGQLATVWCGIGDGFGAGEVAHRVLHPSVCIYTTVARVYTSVNPRGETR